MLLKTDAECLCEGFKNSAQLGVVLNVTIAMSLLAAFHVSAPFVSNCGLSTYTGAALRKVIVHHTQRSSSLFRKQQASPLILRHQQALMNLYKRSKYLIASWNLIGSLLQSVLRDYRLLLLA
ncbi:Non-specific lipid-transfer protein-like protein [Capsicum chinense]|nr:Non-specific lipid-transfer protein-like protein [Capsicum chinense]